MLPIEDLPFGEFASEYHSYRPSYPTVALDWLLQDQDGLVVDVGAGTGKLTEQLAARCRRLVAIEPDAVMLECLRQRLPEVRAMPGTAESLPLPPGSVQTLIAAQSWHWFDPLLAAHEAVRVVSPGGRLGLLWNAPAPLSDWQRELCAVRPQVSPVNEGWWPRGLPRAGTETKIFYWTQLMTPVAIAREHETHLKARKLPRSNRELYVGALLGIANAAASESRTERLPYRRMTWCARRQITAATV